MAWKFNSSRSGSDISVRIGAVKIANIHLVKNRRTQKWNALVRFLDSDPEPIPCQSVEDALRLIHHHLNASPKQGANDNG